MQLTSRQDFPADPATVHAMVTDEEFLAHAARRMGSPDARVEATPERSRVEASVESPPEVRSFIGPRLAIVQETTWGAAAPDGSRDGTISITVPGAPVTLVGTVRLAPTASGSTIDYDGDLDVKIPLVGGRVEREAAPAILDSLETQARVGRDWLTR